MSRGTVAREFRVIFERTGQPSSFSSKEKSPFTEAALSKRLVRPRTARHATSVSSSPPDPTSSPVIDFFQAKESVIDQIRANFDPIVVFDNDF